MAHLLCHHLYYFTESHWIFRDQGEEAIQADDPSIFPSYTDSVTFVETLFSISCVKNVRHKKAQVSDELQSAKWKS